MGNSPPRIKTIKVVEPPARAAGIKVANVAALIVKLKNEANTMAQKDLAATIMGPEFQETFSLNKGSIPVRVGVKMDKFDECAKQSSSDFGSSAKAGTLLPSIAHGMAVPSAVEGAIKDAISQFWNSDRMSAREAMQQIATAARTK